MKKIVVKLLFSILIIVILAFAFIKVNTDIYVGDYSWDCCNIDVQIRINDQLLLDDSLTSNPYMVGHHFRRKLKYGFNKIGISSCKAKIDQEQKIFLLPNQYISIVFFSADTLCLEERMEARKTNPFFVNNYSVEKDSSFLILDTINEKSNFFIESRFNPFYLE